MLISQSAIKCIKASELIVPYYPAQGRKILPLLVHAAHLNFQNPQGSRRESNLK